MCFRRDFFNNYFRYSDDSDKQMGRRLLLRIIVFVEY
jgi:hypothetical protein